MQKPKTRAYGLVQTHSCNATTHTAAMTTSGGAAGRALAPTAPTALKAEEGEEAVDAVEGSTVA